MQWSTHQYRARALSLSLCLSREVAERMLTTMRITTHPTICLTKDMERFSEYNKPLGINVVPAVNPDVVPSSVSREVEKVNPICTSTCTRDGGVQTVGYCRQASGADGIALCAVPSKLHTVAWASTTPPPPSHCVNVLSRALMVVTIRTSRN